MPGIAGCISAAEHPQPPSVAPALEKLTHFEHYGTRHASPAPNVAIGQVWRSVPSIQHDWALDAHVSVFVNGSVLEDGIAQRRLTAADVRKRYVNDDLDLAGCEGPFVVVVVDRRRGKVIVANDRLGALPVVYARDDTRFAFAPEIKGVLSILGIEPKLSRRGIISFLTCGYCLGETTLFEGVKILRPGSMLQVDTSSLAARSREYWKLIYEPSAELRRRGRAEERLFEAARHAHRLLLCDAPRRFSLMLSGGYDSRGCLAFLNHIGNPPTRACSWGVSRDIPYSDPWIAAELSRAHGIPFHFIQYDSDQLVQNAEEWCYLSELATDNFGWFGEGSSLLAHDYAASGNFSLTGDENWGNFGRAADDRSAVAMNFPPSVPDVVSRCLRRDERAELEAEYAAEVRDLGRRCPNDHPVDRRDYYYQYGRAARYLYALGYYKELATQIRRPFVTQAVLDVNRQLPRRLRLYKNLYLSMLARYFPDVAAVPGRRARSLPDWRNDIRAKPALRRLLLGGLDTHVLAASEVGALLDVDAFERLKDAFFARAAAAPPAPAARRVRGLKDRVGLRTKQRLRAAGWYLRRPEAGAPLSEPDSFDLIRRVFLLSMLEQTFSEVLSRSRTAQARQATSSS